MRHTFHQHITIGIYTICSYGTLIACLLFLISCGQPLAGTTASTPTKANIPTSVSGKAVLFERLRMFNVSTGWAVTYEPSHSCRLLHTTAGVTQWQDVTPVTGSKDCSIDGTDFFDPFVAWIAVDATPNLFIYHTYDGGQTWRKTQLPDQGNRVDHLFFLDKQIGWLLVDKAAAASREAVDILKTSDGGATWKIISVSDSSTVNNSTAIPFEGDKSGLSFVSMTTGWITAFTAKDHFPWLYVTHDGGVTWQHQTISLPANAFQVTTLPPIFFTTSDGFLPVIIPTSESQTVNIYVTHDGGASWSATNPVPTSAEAGTITVVDTTHSWIVGNTFDVRSNQYIHSTVYSTNTEGEHWMHHDVKFGTAILMIDFVSPLQGWAIDALHTLYQTTDGGQSWTKV